MLICAAELEGDVRTGEIYGIAPSIVVLVREHGPSAVGSPACQPSLGRNTHPDSTPTRRASKHATSISPLRDAFSPTPPGTPGWPPHTDRVRRLLRQPLLELCAETHWAQGLLTALLPTPCGCATPSRPSSLWVERTLWLAG